MHDYLDGTRDQRLLDTRPRVKNDSMTIRPSSSTCRRTGRVNVDMRTDRCVGIFYLSFCFSSEMFASETTVRFLGLFDIDDCLTSALMGPNSGIC